MLNLNPFDGNYKELQAAYPRFYLDVLEMQAILKAEGKLLDDVTASIELVVDNNFIDSADEKTITMLEQALGLGDTSSMTLNQRKQALKALIGGVKHFGEPEIRYIVSGFIEGTVAVRLVGGAIKLTVEQSPAQPRDVPSCVARLEQLKPAHLRLDLLIREILKDELSIYVGLAMQVRENFETDCEIPVIPPRTFLTDEDDNILTDEDGHWLSDEEGDQ